MYFNKVEIIIVKLISNNSNKLNVTLKLHIHTCHLYAVELWLAYEKSP